MSIIQEALKRAQYNYAGKKSMPEMQDDRVKQAAIPASVEALDARSITKKIAVIIYVIILLALVTGFGIRALFLKIATMDKERRTRDMATVVQKTETEKVTTPGVMPGAVERATERLIALASSVPASQVPNLTLNGIMYTEERPKAIINGTVVRVGDVISGATVTSITENNVLLKYNNNDNQIEMALKLKE